MKRSRIRYVYLAAFMAVAFYRLAQAQNVPCNQHEVRIDANLPQVYMTFEGMEKRKPRRDGESGDFVILKLHNNTIWAINVVLRDFVSEKNRIERKSCNGTSLKVVKPGANAEPYYFSDNVLTGKNVSGRFLGFALWDDTWLTYADTLTYAVPKEDLAYGYYVNVSFTYEWEDYKPKLNESPRDVSHHASFYPREIPESVRNASVWPQGTIR